MREDDEVTFGRGAFREERRRDPSRVLALTDGVFAIIITRRPPGPVHADQVHRPRHHLAQSADAVRGVPAAVRLLRHAEAIVYIIAFAIAGVSSQASLAVYASGPVLYFIAITLLRLLAPRGSAERQFT